MNQVNDDSFLLAAPANTCIDAVMRQEFDTIQKQKADAEREMKAIDARRIELEQWLRDLAVTERTLARILDLDLPNTGAPSRSEHSRRKKPDNIPSVHDMTVKILRERGEEFVEGNEIFVAIKGRWWPDATKNDVLPTLWRLATKDDRLRKEGSKYALPIREGIRDPSSLVARAS